MRIESLTLRQIELPLVHFFETSFRRTFTRQVLLLETRAEGLTGFGECVAGAGPFYSSESVDTAWEVLTRWLLPSLPGHAWDSPSALPPVFSTVRGHRMAKSAVEATLWDLRAQSRGEPLWKLIGGTQAEIPCGVSIGIQDTVDQLLEKIEGELSAGYRKIKIKIKPGWDVAVCEAVRDRFPEIELMVDANSAYRLEDAEHLRLLDRFDLMMIEQPLYHDDIACHARLQAQLETPICLDESIRHLRDARLALELGACRIINIKMGRLGGLTEAIAVHDCCRRRGVPVWCGGMLETGIGRAHNIALSTLPNFILPGDVSASSRYYERDVIDPPVTVTPGGTIVPPEGPGLGYGVDLEWIEANTVRRQHFGE